MISGTDRLTGGGVLIQPGGECDATLKEVRALIREKYPKLKQRVAKSATSCSYDTSVQWHDPTSGSTIASSIQPQMGALQLTYVAPDALDAEIRSAKVRHRGEVESARNRF
jgi:hypothetical protein